MGMWRGLEWQNTGTITPCSFSLPGLWAEEQGEKKQDYECYAWIFLSTTSERLIRVLTKSCTLLLRLERRTDALFL